MMNFKSLSVFGLFLLLSSVSQAGQGSRLKCVLENNRERILSIEISETDLEGQLVALTTVMKADHSEESIQRVSNGSLSDSKIYLFETGQVGVGTTSRYLERNRKTGTFSISHYFQCDWINHEETCSPGSDLEYRGSSGDAVCTLVTE